jgi:hypothetical protein
MKTVYRLLLFGLISASTLISCSQDGEERFRQLSSSQTNITFSNDVEPSTEFNIQNYLYFYDGGGVAAGDINNDGLTDLFFTGNMVQNRLYINRGNFEFEDVTESAGIQDSVDSWSTGVSMADVNGDGYLDIYVSRVNFLVKQGANQLFINNGDGTFSERAADFGLDFEGYSTQAAFFDYNNDGRLDLFQMNHSFHSENTYGQAEILRQRRDEKGGDRLYRNDGDTFTDVTEEANIISSALGYGLGLAITDINQDGYADIYVGNDFHEDDYFYLNNGDGTFTNSTYDLFGHTSNSSMGNDVADILNNGRMDILSLDMMPVNHQTFMRSGGADLVIVAEAKRNFGFGDKNNRNTLQINKGYDSQGVPIFSEMAFASGIARTDWSWAALFADYDNNGFNDLYVINGIPQRPNDLDYIARLRQTRENFSGEELESQIYALQERMPVDKTSNVLFKNNEDLTFTNVANQWGLDTPSFSTGAVYADLNNDGYLDLVVNNINEDAFIYENRPAQDDSSAYLSIKLNGTDWNRTGIGSKVFVYEGESIFYREQFPVRGFQSSVDHVLHVGLGNRDSVDSLKVVWPDGAFQTIKDVALNTRIVINHNDASGRFDYSQLKPDYSNTYLTNNSDLLPEEMVHNENQFDDFSREPLIPYKLSSRGPAMAVGDINGDGREDIYLGGSRNFAGKLFLQAPDGSFTLSEQESFTADRRSEDVDALFFDATGNGNLDLLVTSGGHEYTGNSPELIDRLYLNTGDGVFRRSTNTISPLGVNSSVARTSDIDDDGDLDLFIAGHSIPWKYGIGTESRILQNNGNGVFQDITSEIAPELETIGNVTSAEWMNVPGEDFPWLVVTGEWMPVHIFKYENDQYTLKTSEAIQGEHFGLWQSLHVVDLTGDGHQDIIAGNFGLSSRMQPSDESPIFLNVNDFNENGQTVPLVTYLPDGVERPFESLDELLNQFPEMQDRVNSYADFSTKSVDELVEPAKLDSSLRKKVNTLESKVFLNNGDGTFEAKTLPIEAQTFPVTAIYEEDVTGNGATDIILAGNIYDVKPSYGGRQDAGYGLVLQGDGEGNFSVVPPQKSGYVVRGEGRSIRGISIGSTNMIITGRNDQQPLLHILNNVN